VPGAEREAALAAYRSFWSAASTVDSRPEGLWRAILGEVAAEPLLTRVLAGLRAEAVAGHRQYGMALPRPTVVRAERGRASIVDRQDASGSGVLDAATGLPVSVGAPRTPIAASLVRDRWGMWRVSDARYLQGPC